MMKKVTVPTSGAADLLVEKTVHVVKVCKDDHVPLSVGTYENVSHLEERLECLGKFI